MNQILAELKKAVDLWMDKTYDESAFYSHISAIIRDNSEDAQPHIDQIERLIFKVQEMREAQRNYHAGHKHKLAECKKLEKEMDQKIFYLLNTRGYSVGRFTQQPKEQQTLFK